MLGRAYDANTMSFEELLIHYAPAHREWRRAEPMPEDQNDKAKTLKIPDLEKVSSTRTGKLRLPERFRISREPGTMFAIIGVPKPKDSD